jgi:hypothetical protein
MILAVLCCLVVGPYAVAIDKPPEMLRNQRFWLQRGLGIDMAETNKRMPGTFGMRDFARDNAIKNRSAGPMYKTSDSDVRVLANYYYHTRERAEEDLRQFERQLSILYASANMGQFQGQFPNPQQAGPTDKELEAAKADREAISTLGGSLADKGDAVKCFGELIYASLPGFCLREKQMLPASYFDLDQVSGRMQYVGPAYNAAYAGVYVTPIDTYLSTAAARQASWLRNVSWWHQWHQQGVVSVPGGGPVPVTRRAGWPVGPIPNQRGVGTAPGAVGRIANQRGVGAVPGIVGGRNSSR